MSLLNTYGSSNSNNSGSATQGDLSKDIEVPQNQLPSDSISDMAFSPTNDYLAVASWDCKVRIYEVSNLGVQGKWAFEMKGPVLAVAWAPDGTRVAGASTDKTAAMVDLRNAPQTGGDNLPTQVIATHTEPVKCVRWIRYSNMDVMITGSWDKTVKFWDSSNGNQLGSIDCGERIYTLDVKVELLVVGVAGRQLHIITLKEPSKIFKSMASPLKWQTRVVSCFSDGTGFAIGSIEGRCAIQWADDKDHSLNFSFKCHRHPEPTQRDVSKVFSVNAISFHPVHGTFSTAGSDGTYHFWDKDAKHRLKGYPEVGGPITATAFSRGGDVFAYAISYDWHKGYAFNNPQQPIKIKLHPVQGEECKPRPGKGKGKGKGDDMEYEDRKRTVKPRR